MGLTMVIRALRLTFARRTFFKPRWLRLGLESICRLRKAQKIIVRLQVMSLHQFPNEHPWKEVWSGGILWGEHEVDQHRSTKNFYRLCKDYVHTHTHTRANTPTWLEYKGTKYSSRASAELVDKSRKLFNIQSLNWSAKWICSKWKT